MSFTVSGSDKIKYNHNKFLQMVFGNCGVLQEMSADKGYVEMTGIDAETSQDIAEVRKGFINLSRLQSKVMMIDISV